MNREQQVKEFCALLQSAMLRYPRHSMCEVMERVCQQIHEPSGCDCCHYYRDPTDEEVIEEARDY